MKINNLFFLICAEMNNETLEQSSWKKNTAKLNVHPLIRKAQNPMVQSKSRDA